MTSQGGPPDFVTSAECGCPAAAPGLVRTAGGGGGACETRTPTGLRSAGSVGSGTSSSDGAAAGGPEAESNAGLPMWPGLGLPALPEGVAVVGLMRTVALAFDGLMRAVVFCDNEVVRSPQSSPTPTLNSQNRA